MRKIVYNSAFLDRADHGGGHRWAQLEDLIRSTGIESGPFELPQKFSKTEKLSGMAWLIKNGFLHGAPSRSWIYIGGLFENICKQYEADRPKLILTETLDMHGCILAAVSCRLSIPLVVCPPNLDSLLYPFELHNTFHPPFAKKYFSPEFAWLSLADAVFTIASEEAFVLNNAGIAAHFLPYFPSPELANHLQSLRPKRNPESFYLVLGSTINPPTKEGLLHQLAFLENALQPNESVIVVGRGTDEINCNIDRVSVEGTVSNERLAELLQTCKAAWLHQTVGVGALTRISELLLSGVPIVASVHATRSAPYADLIAYDDFDQALESLRGQLPAVAAAPVLKQSSFNFFQDTLHYLCR